MSQRGQTSRKRKISAPNLTWANKVSKTSSDKLTLSQPADQVSAAKKTGALFQVNDLSNCCDICLKVIETDGDDDDSFIFTCTVCKHSSHGSCLDFEESCLDLIAAVYKSISWTCKGCQDLARSSSTKGKVTNRMTNASNISNELETLRARLAALEKVVFDLTARLQTAPIDSTDDVVDKDPRSWASVVKTNTQTTTNNIQISDVIKAVHGDLISKKNREKNVVITGLKPSSTIADKDLFRSFCASHLGIHPIPEPVSCRRLVSTKKQAMGNSIDPNHVHPLLVVFSCEEGANRILSNAKLLRQSSSDYVKASVYINRDLTKAEAAAEFEIRERRRAKAKASSKEHSSIGAESSQVDGRTPPANILRPLAKPFTPSDSISILPSVDQHPSAGRSSDPNTAGPSTLLSNPIAPSNPPGGGSLADQKPSTSSKKGGWLDQDPLKCVLTNIRSLKNKLPEFHNLLYSRLPDLAFITESWLNTSITNNMLDPDRQYNIYRSDRIESKVGGGSIVFVQKRYKCDQVQIPDTCKNLISVSGCDIICFDIYFKIAKYRFILVYRPPVLFLPKVDQVHKMQALTQILSSLSATKATTFILGDFNLPNIDWINYNAKHNSIDDVFMNCMSTLGMTQFITNPTRLSFSTGENILDLILSNDPSSVHINDHQLKRSFTSSVWRFRSILHNLWLWPNLPLFHTAPHLQLVTSKLPGHQLFAQYGRLARYFRFLFRCRVYLGSV